MRIQLRIAWSDDHGPLDLNCRPPTETRL